MPSFDPFMQSVHFNFSNAYFFAVTVKIVSLELEHIGLKVAWLKDWVHHAKMQGNKPLFPLNVYNLNAILLNCACHEKYSNLNFRSNENHISCTKGFLFPQSSSGWSRLSKAITINNHHPGGSTDTNPRGQ